MPLSAEEKKAFNKEAYGSENYPEYVADYLADNSHLSLKMLAMSVLSDAQERLANIDPGAEHAKVLAAMNQVRQDMNKSKYMIDTYLLDKRKPFSTDDVEQAFEDAAAAYQGMADQAISHNGNEVLAHKFRNYAQMIKSLKDRGGDMIEIIAGRLAKIIQEK